MVTPCRQSSRSRGTVAASLALGLIALCAAVTAGCDKVPLTAPSGSTLTLFTSTSFVPVNGTADITATVIEEAGTAVQNGTQVTFTTSLGSIDPPQALTKNGQVTVKFIAGGQSGTATISAYSGGANSGGSSGGDSTTNGSTTTTTTTSGAGTAASVQIKIGGAGASRISVTANPSSVPSQGGTAEVIATVFDADGNRIPGVPVSFTTTAGSFSLATVVTDSNGEARTSLKTDRKATVTVAAGAAKEATLTVDVNTAPTVSISVAATPVPTAGQATVFTVKASVGTNGSPIREVVVDFGDGTRQTLSGTVDASLAHVYTAPGYYSVTATATDTTGERAVASTIAVVTASAPVGVTVTADTTQPTVNTPVSITVAVTPTTTQVQRYEYDFGDGTSTVLNSPRTTHIYASTGVKTITVRVVTLDGQGYSGQMQIVVTP